MGAPHVVSRSAVRSWRLRRWVVDQRWWIFTGFVLVTVLLGIRRFAQHFDEVGGSRSFADLLYLSLQLFTLESGSIEPPVNWNLNLARLAAPTLTAAATAGVISVVVSALRDRGSIAWTRRDHVIVCGLGRKGMRLARGLGERGDRVVVIDRDPHLAAVERRNAEGMTIIHGDATDERILRRAGLGAASELYAVTGNDGVNAAIAVHAQQLPRLRSKPLLSRIHIVDRELKRLLRPVLERSEENVVSSVVNVYDRAATILVDDSMRTGSPENGAVIIIGVGNLGQSLVVELATRVGSLSCPVIALLVDRRADQKVAELNARHPELRECWSLRAHEADITSQAFEDGDYLGKLAPSQRIDHVYILIENDELAFVTALTVGRTLGCDRPPPPIVVRLTGKRAGLGALIRPGHMPSEYATISAFDLHEKTCGPDVFAGLDSTATG